jgi:integrase
LYDLHHGCASPLLSQGVPLSTVSRILGHSTITPTTNTYAHLFPGVQREAAPATDAMFAPTAAGS